jgi:hypothetical protein
MAVESKGSPCCNSKFCLVLSYYLFGLAAAPYSAAITLHNGGNIVIWVISQCYVSLVIF